MQRAKPDNTATLFADKKNPATGLTELTTVWDVTIDPKVGFSEKKLPCQRNGSYANYNRIAPDDHQFTLNAIASHIEAVKKLPFINNTKVTYCISMSGKLRGENLTKTFDSIDVYRDFLRNNDLLPANKKTLAV